MTLVLLDYFWFFSGSWFGNLRRRFVPFARYFLAFRGFGASWCELVEVRGGAFLVTVRFLRRLLAFRGFVDFGGVLLYGVRHERSLEVAGGVVVGMGQCGAVCAVRRFGFVSVGGGVTLRKKHEMSGAECVALIERYREDPPVERAERLVSVAVERVEQLEGTLAFAWSGGKDSQGLRLVSELAGVDVGMCVETGLEWPVMNEWRSTRMSNIERVSLGEYDAEWLNSHREHLFTYDAKIRAVFAKATHHKGQERFYKEHALDGMLLGRRWVDDNWTGFAAGDMSYISKKTGMTRHSPLADWSHEDLFAVMVVYGLEFAPCYDMLDGWNNGTANWKVSHLKNGKKIHDLDESYDWNFGCVWQTDPGVLIEAADVLEPARRWLDANV